MSDLKPTTMTQNGNRVVQASSSTWGLYLEMKRILTHSMALLGVTETGVADAMVVGATAAANADDKMAAFVAAFVAALNVDFTVLQSDYGYSTIGQAQELFSIVVLAASQVQAEEINLMPNALRAFMHRVG